jgi:hypothetical protein
MTSTPPATPTRRVVLLGASNVARSLPTLVDIARRRCAGPLDLLAACGNGRSYGVRTRWFGRELPGIVPSGLWDVLANRPTLPTSALVTDVGNDLLYDVEVPQIVAWVESCVERLQRAGAQVVLTPLPLRGILAVSATWYALLKAATCPRCRLDRAGMLARAEELDARLRDLARARGLMLVEPRPEWYGFDLVHIRAKHCPAAWAEILSPWPNGAASSGSTALTFGERLRLRLLPPERRWLFGRQQDRAQPAGTLPDGSTLALY